MGRYLIKSTYLEGPHEGQSHLLRKGGYVTEEGRYEFEDTTYASKSIAERWCKHFFEENERNRKIERQDEAWKVARGGKPKSFYLYMSESYEPYEVPEDMMVRGI